MLDLSEGREEAQKAVGQGLVVAADVQGTVEPERCREPPLSRSDPALGLTSPPLGLVLSLVSLHASVIHQPKLGRAQLAVNLQRMGPV